MTITITSNDFATEVKTDRLMLLWRVTLIASASACLLAVTMMTFQDLSLSLWLGTPLVLVISALITRGFLKSGRFIPAAWVYALGALLAVGVGMVDGDVLGFQLVPFMFIVVIFIGGLLLPAGSLLTLSLLAVGSTLLIPWAVSGNFDFLGGAQVFAITLMLLAAALAAQITGELYAVTEWALLNYQRERSTNTELFDNRQKLELSLKRSEALGDRLQMTNADLENARASAEAAKNFRGQFLANMSHELRTPLNAIIGFSETMLKFPMMYDGVALPEMYEADINQIFTSGKQLLTLINDILDLAKVDAGKLETRLEVFDMKPLIDAALATAGGLLGGKPVVMRTELPPAMPKVLADTNRVRQVLLNLYSNAVKFTDRGEIVLSVYVLPTSLHISLCDTGIGIPAASLELIFEEFKQADNDRRDPRSGSGLGLAISRQLVQLMGGRIWAESTPGVGSNFHFTLPLAANTDIAQQPLPTTVPVMLDEPTAI
ncbi:MAG: hypothetical protein H7Y11_04825 [Armatimonadetes bacterium]|nr:hypothetical protein [Anaerolineae bacterium]